MADASTVTRRGLILAVGTALAGAVASRGIAAAALDGSPPMTSAGALAFDPAAFVADLRAAGYRISIMQGVPQPGWDTRAPTYSVTPGPSRGFDKAFFAVMARWSDAMDACPDHVERVVTYALKQIPQT